MGVRSGFGTPCQPDPDPAMEYPDPLTVQLDPDPLLTAFPWIEVGDKWPRNIFIFCIDLLILPGTVCQRPLDPLI